MIPTGRLAFHIGQGMRRARELLLAFAELVCHGSEPGSAVAQYLDGPDRLVRDRRTHDRSARTQMASGTVNSVGFKNGTDGGLEWRSTIRSARSPHSFLVSGRRRTRSYAHSATGSATWCLRRWRRPPELRHGQRTTGGSGPGEGGTGAEHRRLPPATR